MVKKNQWNTYRVVGYTYQAGTDQRACGGVHLLEVCQRKSGWLKRVADSNGRFYSPGSAEEIPAAEGEALFADAQAYAGG